MEQVGGAAVYTAESASAAQVPARALLEMPNTHAKPDYGLYLTKAAALAEVKRIVVGTGPPSP
jgi:hypothetical protein